VFSGLVFSGSVFSNSSVFRLGVLRLGVLRRSVFSSLVFSLTITEKGFEIYRQNFNVSSEGPFTTLPTKAFARNVKRLS
jgi:hypothetical protein